MVILSILTNLNFFDRGWVSCVLAHHFALLNFKRKPERFFSDKITRDSHMHLKRHFDRGLFNYLSGIDGSRDAIRVIN